MKNVFALHVDTSTLVSCHPVKSFVVCGCHSGNVTSLCYPNPNPSLITRIPSSALLPRYFYPPRQLLHYLIAQLWSLCRDELYWTWSWAMCIWLLGLVRMLMPCDLLY